MLHFLFSSFHCFLFNLFLFNLGHQQMPFSGSCLVAYLWLCPLQLWKEGHNDWALWCSLFLFPCFWHVVFYEGYHSSFYSNFHHSIYYSSSPCSIEGRPSPNQKTLLLRLLFLFNACWIKVANLTIGSIVLRCFLYAYWKSKAL